MYNAGGENDWKKLVRRENLHIQQSTSIIDASAHEVSLAYTRIRTYMYEYTPQINAHLDHVFNIS